MAGDSMKFNVAQARELASQMTKIYNSYTSSLQQAEKETQKLKNCWTGTAANAFMATYAPLSATCNEYMVTLKKTIDVLNEVATSYEATESKLEAAADNLPTLPNITMN